MQGQSVATKNPIDNVSLQDLVRNSPFKVEQIGSTIGAEVHGLDLAHEITPECFRGLEAAVILYKVVYLRGQKITSARHVQVGKMFGELETHPFRPQGELPELVRLDNHKDNPVLSTDIWHSDTQFRRCPTKYSILRCLRSPATGGDTLWADMAAAYHALSEPFRRGLEGLRTVNDFQNFRALYDGGDEEQQDELRKMEELFPNPSHPLVRTHPVTGEKILYVNGNFTVRIEGMRPDESRLLLDFLFEQAKIPEFQFRLRWAPGTIAFWDNRSTQHYANNDYYPVRRTMERVAVVGDEPF